MSTITLVKFKNVLSAFCKDYPRPKLENHPLLLSTLYSLEDDYNTEYPNASHAGVYVFFDKDKCVLYIGKTSCRSTFDDRFETYFRYKTRGKGGTVQKGKERFKKVRYIATIPLPSEHRFEAGAIEEYLIDRLNPVLNHVGKSKR